MNFSAVVLCCLVASPLCVQGMRGLGGRHRQVRQPAGDLDPASGGRVTHRLDNYSTKSVDPFAVGKKVFYLTHNTTEIKKVKILIKKPHDFYTVQEYKTSSGQYDGRVRGCPVSFLFSHKWEAAQAVQEREEAEAPQVAPQAATRKSSNGNTTFKPKMMVSYQNKIGLIEKVDGVTLTLTLDNGTGGYKIQDGIDASLCTDIVGQQVEAPNARCQWFDAKVLSVENEEQVRIISLTGSRKSGIICIDRLRLKPKYSVGQPVTVFCNYSPIYGWTEGRVAHLPGQNPDYPKRDLELYIVYVPAIGDYIEVSEKSMK